MFDEAFQRELASLDREAEQRFRLQRVLFVTIWLWVLSWLPLALVPNLLWFGIVNVSTFMIASVYLVAQSSYQLSLIPNHLQGRVNSVTRLLIMGSQPLGVAVTGVLIQRVGPVGTVLVCFVPQLLLAGAVTLFPRLLFAPASLKQDTSAKE